MLFENNETLLEQKIIVGWRKDKTFFKILDVLQKIL